MMMTPIEPLLPRGAYRIVRLLRRWSAAAVGDGTRLPSIVRLGARLGVTPEAAVAVASLFELTEACLARPLRTECCCSARLSGDERAVLTMLAAVTPVHPHLANANIPHGLPGALIWAVRSVRALLDDAEVGRALGQRGRCPFEVEPIIQPFG